MVSKSVQSLDWKELTDKVEAGLCLVDRQRRIFYLNDIARWLLGPTAELGQVCPLQLVEGTHRVPSPNLDAGPILVHVHPAFHAGQPCQWLHITASEEGDWEDPDTEQIAYQDSLTGLPNLQILRNFVDFTCTQTQRYKRSAAILQIELDDFSEISQELGPTTADQLLIECASRLQQTVRSSDVVGRVESQRFMVLLTELTNDRSKERNLEDRMTMRDRTLRVAERIREEFDKPFFSSDLKLRVNLSIGCTICPELATQSDQMLEQSELALRTARHEGGNLTRLYNAEQDQLQSNLDLEQLLSQGTIELQFRHCASRDGQTQAQELVASLQNGTQRTPHLLERAALVGQFNNALSKLLRSASLDGPNRWIVSIPSRQLLHADLANSLGSVFQDAGLTTKNFILSVPEHAVLHGPGRRLSQLQALAEQGFEILLDCERRPSISLVLLTSMQPRWLRVSDNQPNLEQIAKVAQALGIGILTCPKTEASPDTKASKPKSKAKSKEKT